MSRIKHVLSEDGVAHAFVHQTQDSARKASGNFSFEGERLFSYGTCIACHVENHKKQKALLVTTRSYSVTTSGQMSTLRQALHNTNLTIWHVSNVTGRYGKADYLENFKELVAGIERFQKQLLTATSRAGEIVREIRAKTKYANDYAKFFGIPQRTRITNAKTLAKREKHGDELKAKSEQREKDKRDRKSEYYKQLEAKREQERQKELAEAPAKLEKWLKGESNEFPEALQNYHQYDDIACERKPVYLRKSGNTRIQTSLGAEIPYNAGKKLFEIVNACREKQERVDGLLNRSTLEVGGFPVEEIDVDGNLKAGCHRIAWEQIEDFAKREGWIK